YPVGCNPVRESQLHPAFLCFYRHHRLYHEGKGFYDLDAVFNYLGRGSTVGFDQFPRCVCLDIHISESSKGHDGIDRALELVLFHLAIHTREARFDFGSYSRIDDTSGYAPELLMRKKERSVHEVSQDIDDLVVDPLAKDLPREVEFLGMARVGKQVVPEVISGKTFVKVIFVGPDNIPPGLREFVVIHFDHPACDNRVGFTVPGAFQEGGPEDAVVVDDIPADEMGDPVILAPVPLPVFASLCCPLFGECYVADRCVNPDVHHEVVAAGKLHAPFKRAGDTPVVQLVFYPADRIVFRVVRAPEPFKERQEVVLKRGESEKIMFLVPELGLCPADLADRVLDLTRFKVLAAALVTFVPTGLLAAVG